MKTQTRATTYTRQWAPGVQYQAIESPACTCPITLPAEPPYTGPRCRVCLGYLSLGEASAACKILHGAAR
jgi:hypothetical protein